jgi:thiol:disulfide interchange protein DsbD
MKKLLLICNVLLCTFAFSNPVETGHARASLVTNFANTQQESFYLGIRLQMQEGWHTYWENPGDSGDPFEVKWVTDPGIIIENVEWPTPSSIPYPPLMTFGYEGDVIFPFKVFRSLDSSIENINAELEFLICADICIPEKASLSLNLRSAKPDPMLSRAISALPNEFIKTNSFIENGYLKVTFQSVNPLNEVYFFPRELDLLVYETSQQLDQLEDGLYQLSLPLQNKGPVEFSGILAINGKGFQVQETLTNAPSLSLWKAIIFALIGGLILNLMPCVFPVISLKVLSFVSMGGNDQNKIRNHALLFSCGVIATFLAIAITLLVIRSSGAMIGWGYQLQSPMIVGILTLVMIAIGLILLTKINLMVGLSSIGSSAQRRNDYFGSFSTGVLAVVVASPCTAPFMGAAIGYALLQPSVATLPIFLSLALGFAGPYLLLALKPKWISSLPKPGPWMEHLKQFFAFPMLATALWLMWVFMLQTSGDALILLLILGLLLGASIWMIDTFSSKWKWSGIIMTALISMQVLNDLPVRDNTELTDSSVPRWSLMTESEMQSMNQAYLINFTAAWCITCQANEKAALSRPRVKEYLNQEDITYIKADWTNRDDDIARGLAKYERSGIPLYIFWKPGMKNSKILPAVLTEDLLLQALQ